MGKYMNKVNVHRVMYAIKDSMFYILEDGDTVFGPIPLEAKEHLIKVLTELQSKALSVITDGKVVSSYGDIEGTLMLKTDINNCVNPFIQLFYKGSVIPCKTSCDFHGSIDLMLERIIHTFY